jgi:predicted permease
MATIGRRAQTDERIQIYWIFLPLIAIVLAYVVGFSTLFLFGTFGMGFGIILGGSILAAALVAILIYKLLNRRNEHMVREATLRRGLIDYLRARAAEKGVGPQTEPYLQAMEAFDRESLMKEERQSPLLWTILCFIPFVNIVAIVLTLYWLTDFAPGHDRRLYGIVQNVNLAGNQVGMGPLLPPAWKSVPDRSYILYLIITILISVFAIYWFYVLIKDLNDHFDNEWMFEDQLMAELQKS